MWCGPLRCRCVSGREGALIMCKNKRLFYVCRLLVIFISTLFNQCCLSRTSLPNPQFSIRSESWAASSWYVDNWTQRHTHLTHTHTPFVHLFFTGLFRLRKITLPGYFQKKSCLKKYIHMYSQTHMHVEYKQTQTPLVPLQPWYCQLGDLWLCHCCCCLLKLNLL